MSARRRTGSVQARSADARSTYARSGRARRRAAPAALLALVLLATGCQSLGEGDTDAGGSPDPDATASPYPDAPVTDDGTNDGVPDDGEDPTAPPVPVAAEVTVTLDTTGEGDTQTFTLTCEPPGGDHPDPDAACAALAAPDALRAFEPVPPDTACTEQYGGPQVATVTGTVAGQEVDARFSRTNGCEIARWDALAPVLGAAGGVLE